MPLALACRAAKGYFRKGNTMPRFKKPDWFEKLESYDRIRFYLRKWAEGRPIAYTFTSTDV
jgi:hypothetical protein